jgi:hypothetical protein
MERQEQPKLTSYQKRKESIRKYQKANPEKMKEISKRFYDKRREEYLKTKNDPNIQCYLKSLENLKMEN